MAVFSGLIWENRNLKTALKDSRQSLELKERDVALFSQSLQLCESTLNTQNHKLDAMKIDADKSRHELLGKYQQLENKYKSLQKAASRPLTCEESMAAVKSNQQRFLLQGSNSFDR